MSFLNKYKDLSPEKTIENIKQFFSNRGYEIRLRNNSYSEINTWSCNLDLYYNNILISSQNGKGLTELYSLASGYAELYERFCNRCAIKNNLFFMAESFSHLTSEQISFSDLNKDIIQKFLNKIIPAEEQENYLKKMLLNRVYADEYKDIFSDKKIILDERIVEYLCGSVGMSAGNTIEEAINQALSEICEKASSHRFYLENVDNYYLINKELITNNTLKNHIKQIEDLGYYFYIFDLSYNFKLPTLMSLLIDPYTCTMQVNFGAFPVFDIALERIITELYQGAYSFKRAPRYIQSPYRDNNVLSVLTEYANAITDAAYFPEDFLKKSIIVESFNKEVFLSEGNYSNAEINEYFKKLSEKLNYSFYYKDNSLCDEIKAIQCFCPELDYSSPATEKYKNSSTIFKKEQLKNAYALLNIPFLILMEESNEKILSEIIKSFNFVNETGREPYLLGTLLKGDQWLPIGKIKMASEFFLQSLPTLTKDTFFQTIFFEKARYFATLQAYSKSYTEEEIKYIFKNFFNKEVKNLDIEQCQNHFYLITEIYIKLIKDFIQSDIYHNYVATYFN